MIFLSQVLIYLSDFETYKIPNCGTDGPYANVESFNPYGENHKKVVLLVLLALLKCPHLQLIIVSYGHLIILENIIIRIL